MGTFFIRQDGLKSTTRINGSQLPSTSERPLLQGDLVELGRDIDSAYDPNLSFRVDLGTSTSPLSSFPGPYTHHPSSSAPIYAWNDDLRRALDPALSSHSLGSVNAPPHPAAFELGDAVCTTSSLFPRRPEDPLPIITAHVSTSGTLSGNLGTDIGTGVTAGLIPITGALSVLAWSASYIIIPGRIIINMVTVVTHFSIDFGTPMLLVASSLLLINDIGATVGTSTTPIESRGDRYLKYGKAGGVQRCCVGGYRSETDTVFVGTSTSRPAACIEWGPKCQARCIANPSRLAIGTSSKF
ncbi:hypothetical protein CF319_g9022 [Tilletia indica]|nr:hypothetical protein CF319_g9022 [Tilletia indica]